MALENIVTGLRTADEVPKVNPDYNSKTLGSTIEYIKDLEKINTETKEGRDDYKKFTGLPTKNVSPEKTAHKLKQVYTDVTEGFDKYIAKHIIPITDELNERQKSSIAYHFCPETDSEFIKFAKYNAVRNTVHTAKEIIKIIEENQDAYVNLQVKNAPDFMKGIVARFPEEVCRIDARDAREKALGAIGKHGSTKFVTETHRHLKTLETAYIADAKALNEKEKEMKEVMPMGLDTDESVKYFAEIETAKAELKKRAEQFETLPELTGTIIQEAINAIQEREKSANEE